MTAVESSVENRVAVITGANSGLGFQTALQLARMGATVVMACRSMDRGETARRAVSDEVPGAKPILIELDVSEPESIRRFGEQFAEQVGRVDLLINNAGIVGVPLTRNSVGHELHLATHHLGAFALTGTLLPLLRAEGQARIVNVGSLAHRFARLDWDDINWETARYGEWRAYARSKLALLTFTMELERRLREAGGHAIALAAHPGFAATEIGRHNAALTPSNAFGKWFNAKLEARVPTAAEAAGPIVHAASAVGVRGGDYYGPTGFLEIGGRVGKARLNPAARDVEAGRRLWAVSEAMTGVEYLSAP